MAPLPSFDLLVDGRRVTVHPGRTPPTAGDLRAALGAAVLRVGARPLPDAALLHRALAHGAELATAGPGAGPTATASEPSADTTPPPGLVEIAVVEIAVVGGPACGPWESLPAGRHHLGRSPLGRLCVDDPTVEPHHAVVDVAVDGTVRVMQLTGALPARLDGVALDGTTDWPAGAVLSIGAARLTIRPVDPEGPGAARPGSALAGAGQVVEHPTDPWRRMVRRAPVPIEPARIEPIEMPDPPPEPAMPPATGLVGAVMAAGGGVAMSLVFGSTMFLAFAAIGASASLATWLVALTGALRRRRRRQRAVAAAVDDALERIDEGRAICLAEHRRAHPPVVDVVTAAADPAAIPWCEPAARPLSATLGPADARWEPPLVGHAGVRTARMEAALERARRIDGIAAPLTLHPGDVVAVHGRIAPAVVRSVLVQLAWRRGPADWRLVVATRRPERWWWTTWLPHETALLAPDDADALRAAADDLSRRLVIVTDEPAALTVRTSPLRRLLGEGDDRSDTAADTDADTRTDTRTDTDADTRTGTAAGGAAGGPSSGGTRRRAVTALVVVDDDATPPTVCRRTLRIGVTGAARWSGTIPPSDRVEGLHVAGLGTELATTVARRLAPLVDPETPGGPTRLPTSVTLTSLLADEGLAPDAATIARRWAAAGPDPTMSVPIGAAGDGTVHLDLARDGPHALVAGTTGAGKSELLRSLVVGSAASMSPQHLTFVLVDYKGGAAFDGCLDLPHTVGMVTDLDDGLAARSLASLEAEIVRRESLLRQVGAADLAGYRSRPGAAPLARLVVVVDEFASLARDQPDFLHALVGVAQRGRSLGLHLVLATQRPSGVVDDDIRANTALRLALRVHDRPDAIDVVGDARAADLPRDVPGRAVLRLGPGELVEFQAAHCARTADADGHRLRIERYDDPPGERDDIGDVRAHADAAGGTEIAGWVRAIGGAAARLGLPAPHRPWLDPLPFPLVDLRTHDDDRANSHPDDPDPDDPDPDDRDPNDRDPNDRDPDDRGRRAGAAVIGVVDDPGRQRRLPLTWRPTDGPLTVIGALGSGVTTTLLALATAVCRSAPPSRHHVYVVDGRGDDRWEAIGHLAHCGAVIAATDTERLHRLLRRLDDEIDRRVTGRRREPAIALIVDGASTVTTALAPVERAATADRWRRVIDEGAAVGVVAVCGDDRSATHHPVGERWLLRGDARNASPGVRPPPVDAPPGRLRIASSRLEAQVASTIADLAALPGRGEGVDEPDPIDVLPRHVDTAAVRAASARIAERAGGDGAGRDPTVCRLAIGLAADDLGPAVIEVGRSEHVLIAGPPGAGVSTALMALVDAWSAVHPHGAVVEVDGASSARSALRWVDERVVGSDGAGPTLLAVDDAHLLADAEGRLAALLAAPPPGLTVVAGARADAVRNAYGHWSRTVAAARCGIVLAATGDGDVLGVQLPRRPLLAPRPGLAWIVDRRGHRLAQISDMIDR